jgi:hypothetical protein
MYDYCYYYDDDYIIVLYLSTHLTLFYNDMNTKNQLLKNNHSFKM